MTKKTKTVIEITDSHVKLFQSRSYFAKKVISACFVRSIQDLNDSEIIRILSDFTSLKKFSPANVILVMSRKFSILKQMRLPSNNDNEIRKMIALQLVNSIPYPIEDIVYEYDVLEKDENGYTKVIVIIIHKEISLRYINLLEKAGFPLNKVTLSSFGVLGWLHLQERKKKLSQKKPTAVINIDLERTEICFCNKDKLIFSRNIHFGSRDLGSDNVSSFIKQINLSLNLYDKENMGPPLEKVILLSLSPQISSLKGELEKEVNILVEHLTGLENVYCNKNVELAKISDVRNLSLSAGFGLVLSGVKKIVNLLPTEIHDTNKTKAEKKKIFSVFLLLFILFVLIAGKVYIEFYKRDLAIQRSEEIISAQKIKLDKAKRKIELVKFLDKHFHSRFMLVDIITKLYKMMPEDITLRSINIDSSKKISIEGYSKERASINSLQDKLVKSDIFSDVNLQFATQRIIFNSNIFDFKIDFKIKGPGEKK